MNFATNVLHRWLDKQMFSSDRPTLFLGSQCRPTPSRGQTHHTRPGSESRRPSDGAPGGGLTTTTAPCVEALSLLPGQVLCPGGGSAASICVSQPKVHSPLGTCDCFRGQGSERVSSFWVTHLSELMAPQHLHHLQLRAQSGPFWRQCGTAASLSAGVGGWVGANDYYFIVFTPILNNNKANQHSCVCVCVCVCVRAHVCVCIHRHRRDYRPVHSSNC